MLALNCFDEQHVVQTGRTTKGSRGTRVGTIDPRRALRLVIPRTALRLGRQR